MDSVTFRAPGSTSNLGSGFDTIGLAVNLYLDVSTRRAARTQYVDPENSAANEMVTEAAEQFFRARKAKEFGVEVASVGDLPHGRGLGASAALRAGVIAGLNALTGRKLKPRTLLNLVTELEGHPDNASPAILGGATISGMVGGEVRCLRFEVSSRLRLVTLVPNFRVATEDARRLLPGTYSRKDAAHALNRSALIAAALASKNYRALAGVFDDRFHQPHRAALVPHLDEIVAAGVKAGAIGGFLSGSGSAIICVTLERAAAVAEAMSRFIPYDAILNLRPDSEGLRQLR